MDMKIVIPSIGEKGLEDSVAEHFGRCAAFTVVEIDMDKKKIENVKVEKNPYYEQHMPFAVPEFIATLKPDLLICAGAGHRAITMFNNLGISFIYGCSGKVKDIVNDFMGGKLEGAENVCKHI